MRIPLTRANGSDERLTTALARFLRTGDADAMSEIVGATRARLLAAARQIGHGQDAEDAVQGAYLSLVRHRGEEMEAPVFPWLLTATVRIAYRQKAVRLREAHLAARLAHETPWARARLADAMPAEEAALVRRELGKLPAAYRDVVALHYLQGLSTAETALLLGVTDAAVRKRLERARELLRQGGLTRLLNLPAVSLWLSDRFEVGQIVWNGVWATGSVMKTSTAVIAIAAAALLGVGVGAAAANRPAQPTPASGALQAHVAELERALAVSRAAQGERPDDRTSRAVRPVPETPVAGPSAGAVAPSAGVASAAASDDRARPSVAAGPHDAVLGRVDWKEIGEHYAGILDLLGKASRAIESGTRPDPWLDQRIEEHALSVIRALSDFSKEVSGGGISKVFTHPAFLANALAASLAKAELPLSEEQRGAIEALALRYIEDDAARVARYDAQTFEIRKFVDEGELRTRFVTAVLDLLTPAQRAFVDPAAMRDRLDGSFFSAAFLWRDHATPLQFADAPNFAERVTEDLAKALQLREDQRAGLREAVDRWRDTLPASWFDGPDDVLSVRGSPRVSVTGELARREIALLEGLRDVLGLDPAQAGAARTYAGTWRLIRTRPR